MEHIIKKLTRELLESWQFTYDGYYWVHENYPFKLINSNKPNTYMVFIEGAGIGQTPPPVETNSGLINLIMAFSESFIQKQLKDQKFLSPQAQGQALAKAMSDYLQFDQNIRMRLVLGAMGQGGLVPDNEYTHTLLSGLECEFKILFTQSLSLGNGVKGIGTVKSDEEIIYYNPECISYLFLESLFPNKTISKVLIKSTDKSTGEDTWTSFFGCGLPKYKE